MHGRIYHRLHRHLRALTSERPALLAPHADWSARRTRSWPRELRCWYRLTRRYQVEHIGPWALPFHLRVAPAPGRLAALMDRPLDMLAFLMGCQVVGEPHDMDQVAVMYTRAERWPGCGALLVWSQERPLELRPLAPSLARYLGYARTHNTPECHGLTHHPELDAPDYLHPARLLPRALGLVLRLSGLTMVEEESLWDTSTEALHHCFEAERRWLDLWPHLAVFWMLTWAMKSDGREPLIDCLAASAPLDAHPTVADTRAVVHDALLDAAGMSDDPPFSNQAFAQSIMRVERQFGRGVLRTLAEARITPSVISTGLPALDIALGIGGLAQGRIVEVYGPEASGKTTLAMSVVASAQRQYPERGCVYIDAERAFNTELAVVMGLRTDSLHLCQPDTAEQALEVADTMLRSGACSVVVIDSVAALTPRAELESDLGDAHIGLQARLMSKAMRKLTAVCSSTQAIVIFINQLRHRIGVMFGSPETTTGGNALKFYASVRLDLRRIGSIKSHDTTIGSRTRIKVVKNLLAPPFTQAEVDLMFGRGFDHEGQVLDLAVDRGLIEKAGSWYSHQGHRLGQGRVNATAALRQDPERCSALLKAMYDPNLT